MIHPDQSVETGLSQAGSQAASVDWDAVMEITGMSRDDVNNLIKNWTRGPQSSAEVRAGVEWEREMRLATADQPGGLTDQIRKSSKRK